jgi:predicted TIM-barrel fold metal-dependent hydrolase
MGGAFKGLALLDPSITDAELRHLKNGGITGFRVKANGKGGLMFADTKKMAARVEGFAWHVEFLAQSMGEIIHAVRFLRSLDMPYVFDHVAHAEPGHKENDDEFIELLSVLRNEEHAWINLYSFYQLSESGPPDMPTWSMSSEKSSMSRPTASSGAAIGRTREFRCQCPTTAIFSIFFWP